MPELLDHIAFLSQEVGPRPAGTEEEQQAALYITEALQKDAGFSAVIEDFNSESNEEIPRAACALLMAAFTIPAMFFPILAVPSLIVAIAAAALYVLESTDYPVISRALARGVSQNVIAKYEPGYSPEAGAPRHRKIVLVSHYDSGKVRFEANTPLLGILPLLQRLSLIAMVFIPAFLVVRYFFFLHAADATAVVLNTITGIALFFALIPAALALLHKFAAYNEAANSNAAGVAVLLEVARRVGRGRIEWDNGLALQSPDATVYGEDAARNAGLVPEGAQIIYEASRMQAPDQAPQTEEERLAAAKAAIATMTGRPVSAKDNYSVAENLVQVKGETAGKVLGAEVSTKAEEAQEALEAAAYEALFQAGEAFDKEAVPGFPGVAAGAGAAAGAVNAAAMPVAVGVGTAAAAGAAVAHGDAAKPPQGSRGKAPAPAEGGKPPRDEAGRAAAAAAVAPAESRAEEASYAYHEVSEVPDWFKKAQEKAKKSEGVKPSRVQRSQYADAFDAAIAESSAHFNRANSALDAETEERLRKMRDEIMEVSAPQRAPDPVSALAAAEAAAAAKVAAAEKAAAKKAAAEKPPVAEKPAPAAPAPAPAAPDGAAPAPADLSATHSIGPIDVDSLRPSAEQGAAPAPATAKDRKAKQAASAPETEQAPAAEAAPPSVATAYQDIQAAQQNALASVIPTLSDAAEAEDVPFQQQTTQAVPEVQARGKGSIVLPDIGASAGSPAPIAGTVKQQQHAPLAAAQGSPQKAAQGLLNMLPSIDVSLEASGSEDGGAASPQSQLRSELRNLLPSLSGSIQAIRPGQAEQAAQAPGLSLPDLQVPDLSGLPALAASDGLSDPDYTQPPDIALGGSFVAPAGATGTFAPIGDKILKTAHPDEVYVDDADDSVYEEGFTETGAFAGSGYVEMPTSRVQRIFGRIGLGKGRDENEVDTGQWLDTDRESSPRPSNGSRKKKPRPEARSKARNTGPGGYDDWEGGAFSKKRATAEDGLEDWEVADAENFDPQAVWPIEGATDEMTQIQQFRHPYFNTEIWFVALGSELANCGGMRAFFAEHEQDLRGSVIVNLRALGSGTLSYLEAEGTLRGTPISSRMKRYVTKAAQALGTRIEANSILWMDSATTVATKSGFQAISIVGMQGPKPAGFSQGDDVLESIDETTLQRNADFVMELLKNI